MPSTRFVVLNAGSARFECTFGRGCDGICCRKVRSPVPPGDARQIDAVLADVLPLLRKEARKVVEQKGYLSGHRKYGQPLLRMVREWCVFFNQGCVLQKIGEARGSKFAYKPTVCALFPLFRRADGNWSIRQKGNPGETWDLFCLAGSPEAPLAASTMKEEFAIAARLR